MPLHKNSFFLIVTLVYFSLINGMQLTDLPSEIILYRIINCFEPKATNIPKNDTLHMNMRMESQCNELYNPLTFLCTTLINLSIVNKQINNLINRWLNEKNNQLNECLQFHKKNNLDLFCYPYKGTNNETYYCTGKLCFSKEKVHLNKYNYAVKVFIEKPDHRVNTKEMLIKLSENSNNKEIPWNQCIDYHNNKTKKEQIKIWQQIFNDYHSVKLTSHVQIEYSPYINIYICAINMILIKGFNYALFCELIALRNYFLYF